MSSTVKDKNQRMADTLEDILSAVRALRVEHERLSSTVEAINGRVNVLADVKEVQQVDEPVATATSSKDTLQPGPQRPALDFGQHLRSSTSSPGTTDQEDGAPIRSVSASPSKRPSSTSRIILTTYPGQFGIDPVRMNWGHEDPQMRGPVVVSRSQSTIRRRNGAWGENIYKRKSLVVPDHLG